MSAFARNRTAVWTACFLALAATPLHADQLQMQNGDRYAGKILSVTSNSIVLQSEILGQITLPRDKVAVLTFGAATNSAPTVAAAPALPATAPTLSGSNIDLSIAFHRMGTGANTNLIQQVRGQMLAGAPPEANQKFDELVDGLMSGKLNVNDIRNQAQTSIEQINALKRELGPEAGDSLDTYLGILEDFVNETATTTESTQPKPNSQPSLQIK
jgi:hypothetical protein